MSVMTHAMYFPSKLCVNEGSRFDVRAKLHQLVQTTISQCWETALGSFRAGLPSYGSNTAHERFLSSTGAYLKDICQLRYREKLEEGKDLDDVCLYAPLLHFPPKEQEVMRQVIDERLRSLHGRHVEKEDKKVLGVAKSDDNTDSTSAALQLEKHLRSIAEASRIKAEERSDELQAELEKLKDILASTTTARNGMMTELDALRAELKEADGALLAERAEVARRDGLRNLALEERKHEAELAEDQALYYRSQIESLQEQLQANADAAEAAMAQYEVDERSAVLKIATLTHELALAKQKSDQQRRRSSVNGVVWNDEETEENQNTEEISKLRTQVANKDTELDTLRAQLGAQMGAELRGTDAEKLQTELENVRAGGNAMKKHVTKLEVEVERLNCIIKDLENDKESFQREISSLLQQLQQVDENGRPHHVFVGPGDYRRKCGPLRTVFTRLFADAVERVIRFERRRSERSHFLAEEFSKVMHKPLVNVLNLTQQVYESTTSLTGASFEQRAKPRAQVNFNSAALYMESNSLRRLPSAMRQRTVQGRVRPASAPLRRNPSAPALAPNVLGF